MSGELKAGEAIPSVRALAKSLHISILTVQKAYATLQEDGFIETTAGKGCYVSAQNQDFYLEEQQKKIEEKFSEAVGIARTSGINLDKLISLLTLLYQEDAEKVNGVWEQRLRIHYNCVGTIEIPSALPLPTPDVSVNTRKGVVVNYAPCDVAI